MLDINKFGKIQRPSAKLSTEEAELAKHYLQGAVHSFCVSNPGKAFALRDLVGGENGNWNGTPLQAIFDYHISAGKAEEKAMKQAAIDAGWLLKAVLAEEENRYFVQSQGGKTKLYRRID